MQQDVLRVITNAAGEFQAHPHLYRLRDDVLDMFHDSSSSLTLKGHVVTWINVLAYNKESRYHPTAHRTFFFPPKNIESLIVIFKLIFCVHSSHFATPSVTTILEASIRSKDPRLWPTDAAIAMANLVGTYFHLLKQNILTVSVITPPPIPLSRIGHDTSHPAFVAMKDTQVMEQLVDALDLTVQGSSYPPGTSSSFHLHFIFSFDLHCIVYLFF